MGAVAEEGDTLAHISDKQSGAVRGLETAMASRIHLMGSLLLKLNSNVCT